MIWVSGCLGGSVMVVLVLMFHSPIASFALPANPTKLSLEELFDTMCACDTTVTVG